MKITQIIFILFLSLNCIYTSPNSSVLFTHTLLLDNSTTNQNLVPNSTSHLTHTTTNSSRQEQSNSIPTYTTVPVSISANITANQIIKSKNGILLSFSQSIQVFSFRFSDVAFFTNVTGLFTNYTLVVPDLNTTTSTSLVLYVNVFNRYANEIGSLSLNFYVDDQWVFVTYITPQGKLLPNKPLTITYDIQPLGINWRWDKDNIITGSYSSSPTIITPNVDGNYHLVLIITNAAGMEETALDYYYIIDGTAPPLTLATDISQPLPSGSTVLFQNTTDSGLDINYFNFSWAGSGVYTTSFPKVPAPCGTHILMASVHDELGNTRSVNYTIKAKIGISNLYPDATGRTDVQMNITLSETPFYANYTFSYLNSTIYSSQDTPPHLPSKVGTYVFTAKLMDVLDNWFNATYTIVVDNTPLTFISSLPANNTLVYTITSINLVFDEVPAFLIYRFNNGVNQTSLPITLPNAAGKYNLTIFASDVALNWIQVNLCFTRFYKPTLSIANNSIVFNNFTLTATIDFPVNATFIHWDNSNINQTFADYNKTSGLRVLNLTLVYNSLVFKNYFNFIINMTVLSLNIGTRVKSNVPILPTFSEPKVSYSWKWSTDTTWKFTPMMTYGSEGTYTLTIRMNSDDTKYSFDQSFVFVIDNTPPQILSINPFTTASNYTTIGKGSKASISFTDKACSSYCYSSFEYQFNNLPVTIINLSKNASVILTIPIGLIPTDASHVNLTVIITDVASNVQKMTYYYTIDVTAPVLLGTNIENKSTILLPWNLELNFSENTVTYTTFSITNNQDALVKAIYTGQNITIPSFLYGNHSVTLICNVSDIYANSRIYRFEYKTIDPALVVHTNSSINTLKEGEKIFFFTNKKINISQITFTTSSATYTYRYLNTSIPVIKNYEGVLNVTVSASDNEGGTVTLLYTIILDTKAPTLSVIGTKIVKVGTQTEEKLGLINSSTTTVVLSPSDLSITVTDAHSAITNITLTDGTANGISQHFSFSNSSYLITIPPLNKSWILYLKFNLQDSYGNAVSYTYTVSTYTSPAPVTTTEQSIILTPVIALIIILIIGIGVVFGLNKKYHFTHRIYDNLKQKNE